MSETTGTLPSDQVPEPVAVRSLARRFGFRTGGTAGNTRLTAMTGLILLALLILQVTSAVFFALLSYNLPLPPGPIYDTVRVIHFLVGFMLMPLIAIKLASTGYRVGRYYTGSRRYHAAGAPRPVPRLIAPLLVGSMVMLFWSGVEMWSFQNQFGWAWTAIHNTSAFAFTAVLTVHIVVHVREAHREAAADLGGAPVLDEGVDPPAREGSTAPAGALTRRGILAGGAVIGVALGVGASSWPMQSLGWLQPVKTGGDALDFPTMNYEGGFQKVDVTRWRLRVTGLVDTPLVLDEATLLAMPNEEHTYAINCVTGWTATRTWRGVPVATVLRSAGVRDTFTHVQVVSTSGYHWDHRRDWLLREGAMLVTHINGVRLNEVHGFPVRLMIPGMQGQSLIKWINMLQVSDGPIDDYFGPHVDFSNPPTVGRPLYPHDPAGAYQ